MRKSVRALAPLLSISRAMICPPTWLCSLNSPRLVSPAPTATGAPAMNSDANMAHLYLSRALSGSGRFCIAPMNRFTSAVNSPMERVCRSTSACNSAVCVSWA